MCDVANVIRLGWSTGTSIRLINFGKKKQLLSLAAFLTNHKLKPYFSLVAENPIAVFPPSLILKQIEI